MNIKPAYGIMAKHGRKAFVLLCLAGLTACTPPGEGNVLARMSVDGVPMRVEYLDVPETWSWVAVNEDDKAKPGGSPPEMMHVPIEEHRAYFVVRADGTPTSEADRDRAEQAITYYYAKRGLKYETWYMASLRTDLIDEPVWEMEREHKP